MKSYFASDMHIGLEDSNYPAIMEFFELVRADGDELILLGDTLDLWTNTFDNITTKEPYKSAYESLIKTAASVQTIMVCGNHDYKLKKFVKDPNIIIKNRFDRNKCKFLHGWEFDALQQVAHPYFELIMEVFPYIYQKYFYKPPVGYALELDQNSMINNIAGEYALKKGYSHIIFGHTHEPMIQGSLLNCGDFVTHASYIIVKDGIAELWDLNKRQ